MNQLHRLLVQAESAKARNMAYAPSLAYVPYARQAAQDGFLDRPPTGHYSINAKGERELARLRRG